VRGLVAVLADGRVISTVGRPRKDNCGFDLAALVAGSEGTLGVITEVEIALHPAPGPSSVALLAVGDLAEAVRCARRVQAGPSALLAAEVVDPAGVARAAAALALPNPLPEGAAWLLLLEIADATGAGLEPVADHVVTVGTDPAGGQRLWGLRERQTELYATLPRLQKLDVSVRLADLDAAVAAIREVVSSAAGGGARGGAPGRAVPDAEPGSAGGAVAEVRAGPPPAEVGDQEHPWVGIFGHALDGNLHVQLVGADGATADRVLEAVAALGGSISAEHGIGRAKVGQLHLARSAAQIDWMRRIKATVDPEGLLNPGVLLAEEG
jgi:FAD/FMN-containing dehydrogenase